MNNLILRTIYSPYLGDVTKGSVLTQAELDTNFINLKGADIYSATTSGGLVNLLQNNGNTISFQGGGSGNQWLIPSGDTVSIPSNFQSFIYGDFYVLGNLNLSIDSMLVVVNGDVYLSGGTITGLGAIYAIELPTFDTVVTGGTFDSISGTLTFTNNSGNTFNVTGITVSSSGSTTGSTGPISVSGTTLFSNSPNTNTLTTIDAIFFGSNAGHNATNADRSIFLGINAGDGALNANDSNFIGNQAGNSATTASYSNFIGANAGYNASGASYSNFLGFNTGNNNNGSLGNNNIIIGTNITLPTGTTNGLNIGGVIFGSGTNSDTISQTPYNTPSGGKIGVNVVTPTSALDVSGTTGYNQFRLRHSYTPTSSSDTNGNIGDIAWDNTYAYIKTNTGWGRMPLDYSF